MSLFDKLSNLVKKEQTEEDKLILDLQEAVKYLSEIQTAFRHRGEYYLFGKVKKRDPYDVVLSVKDLNSICLKPAIGWLNEAKIRASVIINNLEQQQQVTTYRKKIELKENQQELLIALLNLKQFIKTHLHFLNDLKHAFEVNNTGSPIYDIITRGIYLSPRCGLLSIYPQYVIKDMVTYLKTSIKQLKAIKKKQNH